MKWFVNRNCFASVLLLSFVSKSNYYIMKRLNFINFTTTLIAVLFLTFTACENDQENQNQFEDELELFTESSLNEAEILDEALENNNVDGFKCSQPFEICGDFKFYPLIASKKYYVGSAIVYNDSENLYVTYISKYRLQEFHVFVGDVDAFPLNKGNNPAIGKFPYKYEPRYGRYYHTFVIPLTEVPECYTLAIHAVLGDHTIWAKDCWNPLTFNEKFGSKRWGWVIEDCYEDCAPEEKLLTAKLQVKDTQTAGTVWGVVETGTPSDLFSGWWCSNWSVVGLESATYDVIAPDYLGAVKVADMIVVNTGASLEITFQNLIEGSNIEWSYIFLGTEDELVALTDECPDYQNFPYSNTDWATEHSYTIPLN